MLGLHIVLQQLTLNVALSCVHMVGIQYYSNTIAILRYKNIAISIAILFTSIANNPVVDQLSRIHPAQQSRILGLRK